MQRAEPVSNERLSRNTAGTADLPRNAFTARRLLGDTGLYDYRTRTYAPVIHGTAQAPWTVLSVLSPWDPQVIDESEDMR